jgi:hypothetical protein
MVDKYIKSNVCPLPWTHLEVDVNGSASPCCLYKGTIENYKVYETDLKTIQNSDYMERLRQQFRDGERPTGCTNCWQEDAGKTSKRQNSIYKMKHSLTGLEYPTASQLCDSLILNWAMFVISSAVYAVHGLRLNGHRKKWIMDQIHWHDSSCMRWRLAQTPYRIF